MKTKGLILPPTISTCMYVRLHHGKTDFPAQRCPTLCLSWCSHVRSSNTPSGFLDIIGFDEVNKLDLDSIEV